MQFMLRYNMRWPGPGPATDLYRTAVEQCRWADRHGFAAVMLSEHHARQDGYCSSPAVLASAFGAATSRIRILLGALVLPLHDISRIAEDLATADLVSGGRLDVIVGAGYNPGDFAALGRDMGSRYRVLEHGVRLLRQAFSGGEFTVDGRTARVTPRPAQVPGPPLLIGGATHAGARRAARIGDGFAPGSDSADLVLAYRDECLRLGRPPGRVLVRSGPRFLHVAEDPARVAAAVGRAAVFDEEGNVALFRESGRPVPGEGVTWQALVAQGSHAIVTPAACIRLLSKLDPCSCVCLHPLLGGISSELSWSSLKLIAAAVMPTLGGNTAAASGVAGAAKIP